MMNCLICQELKKEIRWEKDSFDNIKKKLNSFVEEKKLSNIGQQNLKSPFLVINYRCSQCSCIWELTYPDQAFRGGFKRVPLDDNNE